MAVVNEFLQFCYGQGWGALSCEALVIIAFAAQMLFLILYRNKYKISLWKIIADAALIYSAGYFLILLLPWLENGFGYRTDSQMVRYLLLVCMTGPPMLKIPGRKRRDFFEPDMVFQQISGRYVYPFAGCLAL